MKKWLLYSLVISLFLTCVGCAEQVAETGTQISSVVSQTLNASVVEETKVPVESKPKEESKPEVLKPVESITSQPKEKPQKEISKPKENKPSVPKKIQFTWKQPSKNNRVEIEGNEVFSVAVCNTYKEFADSLKANLSDIQYTKEYFKTGGLILVTFRTANQLENFVAYELYMLDKTLYMDWVYKDGMPEEEQQVWQYFVEVKEPIKEIETVHCKVHHGSFGYGGEQYYYNLKNQTLQTLVLEEEFIPSNDTVDGNFETGKILVGIKKKYSKVNKVWTAADFPQLKGITKIEDLTYAETPKRIEKLSQSEDFHQLLTIYISGKTKQDVIDGIAALSKNEKLLFAEANNYMTID